MSAVRWAVVRNNSMKLLEGWESFYVIVGSSAGALIGLQFVVMTLLAETRVTRKDAEASGAFATPSVIHFGVDRCSPPSPALHGIQSRHSRFPGD